MSEPLKSLAQLRRQIDQVDQQLLRLLNRRAELTQSVGAIKRQSGAAIFVPEREQSLLDRLETQNSGPLTAAGLRAIYREILSASRASQEPLRVGYLGKGEGETLAAARSRFGDGETYVGHSAPAALIRGVKDRRIHVGLLPRAEMKQARLRPSEREALGQSVWLCSEVLVAPVGGKRCSYLLLSPVLPQPLDHNRTLFLLQGPKTLKSYRDWVQPNGISIVQTERVWIGEGVGWLVEIEGHLTERRLQDFFQLMKEKTLWHLVLGSYPHSISHGGRHS